MRVPARLLLQFLPFLMVATSFLLVPPAVAQYGKAFRNAPKLSSQDITIIRKAVREDLTGKPKGTTLPWRNPESGNSGTVTLLDRFDSAGRDCRRVRYFVKPGPKQPAGVITDSYALTSCRLADGSWKLDNSARPDKRG